MQNNMLYFSNFIFRLVLQPLQRIRMFNDVILHRSNLYTLKIIGIPLCITKYRN